MTFKNGATVVPGDVLDQAVGPSLVLRVVPEHGCFSFLVCDPGGGSVRWLSFWPKTTARVLRHDAKGLARITAAREKAISEMRGRLNSGDRGPGVVP